MPPPGRVSSAATPGIDPDFYQAIGCPLAGPRAIRVDMLDHLKARLIRQTIKGVMAPDRTIPRVLGCSLEESDLVLRSLGWQRQEQDGVVLYRHQPNSGKPSRKADRRRMLAPNDPDRSPFAILKHLATAK